MPVGGRACRCGSSRRSASTFCEATRAGFLSPPPSLHVAARSFPPSAKPSASASRSTRRSANPHRTAVPPAAGRRAALWTHRDASARRSSSSSVSRPPPAPTPGPRSTAERRVLLRPGKTYRAPPPGSAYRSPVVPTNLYQPVRTVEPCVASSSSVRLHGVPVRIPSPPVPSQPAASPVALRRCDAIPRASGDSSPVRRSLLRSSHATGIGTSRESTPFPGYG